MVLNGLAAGLAFMPTTSIVLGGVEPEHAGAASGLLQTFQQLGGAVGLAVIVSVYAAGSVPGEFLPGAQAAFLTSAIMAALAGIAAVAALATWRQVVRGRGGRGGRGWSSGLTLAAPCNSPFGPLLQCSNTVEAERTVSYMCEEAAAKAPWLSGIRITSL